MQRKRQREFPFKAVRRIRQRRAAENETGQAAQKRRGRTCNGSYTVEAAVVVSITFWVLASLILAAFYVHDQAVFQGIVCELASKGSNYATAAERKKALQAAERDITENRFLVSHSLSGNAASGESQVTAAWSAVCSMPGFAAGYLSGNSFTIKKSWSTKIPDPAKTIWLMRGAGQLLDDL